MSIINGVNPNIVTINELGYNKDKKLSIPGYHCYNRNRISQNMGGVATVIRNDEKMFAIKVDEGLDKDEFILTRHCQFSPPINILNIYGEIESRSNKKEIEERWDRVLAIVAGIESRNEALLLIGDMNKAVGNGPFGVAGNSDKVSFGGKLIHNFLSSGNYRLVNNTSKCQGGPFTRMDPADPSTLSCLSLVIVNNDLYDFIDTLTIDKDRIITPHRAIGKAKRLVYTDHFSLHLIFKNLIKMSSVKKSSQKQMLWNTNKSGGWESYKDLTEDNPELTKLLEDDDISTPTPFNENLQKIMNKVKFRAFGKVSFSNRSVVDKPLEELYKEKEACSKDPNDDKIIDVENRIAGLLIQKQRSEYENKLVNLKSVKSNKGKSAAVFSLKAKILGSKKSEQEAVVIEDPVNKELLFETDKIQESSLNYVKNLLKNREPKDDYKTDIEIINIMHEMRMKEELDNDEQFTLDDFSNLLKKLQKDNKMKYKFILKSGLSYQKCLYKLFKMVWESESKPTQWEQTVAHQLFKGAGKKSNLSNYRFIHTKDENPKAFEHIVIAKAKTKIVKGCSKFQIGAIPNHQSQEHLFTLKSVMSWYEKLKIPIIIQLYDISKFFDRENLKDGLNALYNCGINGKLYRLIFELNRRTSLKVKTGVGLSTSTELGENITQGSIGGALISTVNLDYTVDIHFKKSRHELSYSSTKLQPLIFQDDIFRMCSSWEAAQAGNKMIEAVMESKLLDLNLEKSCYIVIGDKKAIKDLKSDLENNPLILCGDTMKEKVSDKYLGDYIHSEGTMASVLCTVKNRFGRISLNIIESRAIIDDCRVNSVGGLLAGLDLWELAILPSLLNNCQTWVNISEDSLKLLEDLQNLMYRTILDVPRTCPIPALCWDLGGVLMKLRIEQKKLEFLWHLLNLDEGTLAREIFNVQITHSMPGLVSECKGLIKELALPDIFNEKLLKTQWKKLSKTKFLNKMRRISS